MFVCVDWRTGKTKDRLNLVFVITLCSGVQLDLLELSCSRLSELFLRPRELFLQHPRGSARCLPLLHPSRPWGIHSPCCLLLHVNASSRCRSVHPGPTLQGGSFYVPHVFPYVAAFCSAQLMNYGGEQDDRNARVYVECTLNVWLDLECDCKIQL